MKTHDICGTCKVEHEVEDLRPYGPNYSLLCFTCLKSSPEMEAVAKANFLAQLNAAEKQSNVVIMGEGTGPRPMNTDSLV
jgi:hypothetical protein